MPTSINFNKRLGVSGGTNITLPSSVPTFADTKSFQFDGAVDRFEGVGTYSELDGLKKATFSFWLKPTLASTDIQFAIMNGSEPQARLLMYSNGIVRMNFLSGGYYTTTPIGSITANVWSHVLFCFDKDNFLGNAGRGQVFINGVYVPGQSNNLNTAAFGVSTSGIYIGAQDTTLPYEGFINELAIWAGEDLRSVSDVAEIYNGGVPNDLNSLSSAPQPTTWQRMGEDAVWDGSKFVMTDVNGGYVNTSIGLLPTDPNPTTDVPLFDNKSFTYDGSLDYVDCGTITALNGGVSVFSTSLWFKYSGTLSTSDNIILSGGTTTSNDFYIQPTSATNIRYGHSASFTDTTVSTMLLNTWYNLILVHNGTGFSIYLNGILQGSSTGKPSPATNLGTNFNIGRYNISSAFNFNGLINDISVFNTDESSNALTIFNGGIVNDISSLNPLGYWRAEEVTFDGTNWTLIDQGSGSNNGTSSSMPYTSRTSDVPT